MSDSLALVCSFKKCRKFCDIDLELLKSLTIQFAVIDLDQTFIPGVIDDIDRATLTSIVQSRHRTIVPVDRIREILEVPMETI
jgi:hypothetical protein